MLLSWQQYANKPQSHTFLSLNFALNTRGDVLLVVILLQRFL
jgi:hypothetical protein